MSFFFCSWVGLDESNYKRLICPIFELMVEFLQILGTFQVSVSQIFSRIKRKMIRLPVCVLGIIYMFLCLSVANFTCFLSPFGLIVH